LRTVPIFLKQLSLFLTQIRNGFQIPLLVFYFFQKPTGPKRGSLGILKFIFFTSQTKLGHKAHNSKQNTIHLTLRKF
jgi:hypothetical protein